MDNEASGVAAPLIEREFSAIIARRVRAQYRRCWRNAAAGVRYLGEGASYVEGWIVVDSASPLIIEHGWCEIDGWIVDPTYTPHVSALREPLAYHAGIRMAPQDAVAALRRGTLPVTHLKDIPEYEAAFRLALLDAKSRSRREARPPTRVVNCRDEPFDVYIGRATKWGNPFRVGADGTREQVVRKYRQWAVRRPGILRALDELRGRRLGCICAPGPCHGDVLAELADFGETVLCEPGPPPPAGTAPRADGGGLSRTC
jgi:hypothetical protein